LGALPSVFEGGAFVFAPFSLASYQPQRKRPVRTSGIRWTLEWFLLFRRMDLMKKGDPIGEWLGRHFLEPLVNRFLPTPEDKKRAFETIQRDDPLIRLGISAGPPEVWKSLLWWGIFVLGMSLAWYMSFHTK
jgi:hypothetical protein